MPHTWWVNNGYPGQYNVDRKRGVHWAPLFKTDGNRFPSWDALRRVKKGDVLVHYRSGALVALGLAVGDAEPMTRPYDQVSQRIRDERGSGVRFVYWDLERPIALEEVPTRIRERGAAFDKNGNVIRGYFFPLTEQEAALLQTKFASRWPSDSPWSSSPMG